MVKGKEGKQIRCITGDSLLQDTNTHLRAAHWRALSAGSSRNAKGLHTEGYPSEAPDSNSTHTGLACTHRAAKPDVSDYIVKDKQAGESLGSFLLRHRLLAALDPVESKSEEDILSIKRTFSAESSGQTHCSTLQLKSRFSTRAIGEAATIPTATKTAMTEEVEKRILNCSD